jgi:thioredoxin-like negative regulator of GroEL
MRRLPIILAALVAIALNIGAARATEAVFDQKAFAAAQQSGAPILVYVSATWCPTCAKQRPILDKLEADPAFHNLTVFKVDFDSQKDVVHAFGVRMQSTLIAFHGATEEARSTGDTNADSIRKLLAATEH